MNYCVEAKHNDNCLKVVEELKDKLSSLDFYESKNQIDYCFSLGGDGTLLRSISKFYTKSPIFVGINLGNLGFLCSFNKDNMYDCLDKEKTKIQELRLIEASLNNETVVALNEIRIESLFGKCLDIKVLIDGKEFSSLKCDGICISSSIGSTGLNKTLGGSVVTLDNEIIQIIEKLPVNNRKYKALNNSLILPASSSVELLIPSSYLFMLCFDSNFKKVKAFTPIKIKLSDTKVKLLVNKEFNHLEKIKEAFL